MLMGNPSSVANAAPLLRDLTSRMLQNCHEGDWGSRCLQMQSAERGLCVPAVTQDCLRRFGYQGSGQPKRLPADSLESSRGIATVFRGGAGRAGRVG
jgi:hypothetical protein